MMWCLQDVMRSILMWVTIYNPFASNLGIVDNWNQFDYPWIIMVPLLIVRYVESLLCNLKSPVLFYTDSIYTVSQLTRTTESEVLHTTLPNRLLMLLQNPKTTAYYQHRVSFRLVYRIRRFIFIHYQHQTEFEPMKLQLFLYTKVPMLSSVQYLQDSSTFRQFCGMRSPLICSDKRHTELPLAEFYAGTIMINSFLCIPYFRSAELVSYTTMSMFRVLLVRLVQFLVYWL